ncbi:MAG: hypothetical protein OEW48_17585, partial [Phycisphaerae bacterium]|nr:hypothetical protein [Phycisphaerae bacterium]
MEKHGFISVVAILLFVPVVYGATITVDDDGPADFSSIQAAINAAVSGVDQVEVQPGIYYEAINFNGKAIRLYSSGGPGVTTIDATGLNSSVVTCNSGEDVGTILEGFTITGGNSYKGGGMYNDGSNPTVTDCIFLSNAASLHGGGMHNEWSNPTVTNCIFSGNTASAHGGGMMNNYGSVSYTANCVFIGNTANGWG